MISIQLSDEEIFKVMKQINPLKAPGPDSMEAIFCYKIWSVGTWDIVSPGWPLDSILVARTMRCGCDFKSRIMASSEVE